MLLPTATWWPFPDLLISLELWSPEFTMEVQAPSGKHRLQVYYRGLLYYRLRAWLSPFPKHMFKLSFASLPRATGPRQCRALPRNWIPTEPWAGSQCPFPSTSQYVHGHGRLQHLEEAGPEAVKLPAGRQTRPGNCGLGAVLALTPAPAGHAEIH